MQLANPVFVTRFLDKTRPRWVEHGLFWLAYMVVFALMQSSLYTILFDDWISAYSHAFLDVLLSLPFVMPAVYLTSLVILPRFLQKNKTYLFFLCVLAICLVFGLLHRIAYWYIFTYVAIHDLPSFSIFDLSRFIRSSLTILLVSGFVTIIKLLKFRTQEKQNTQSITKERLEAELKLLKAQIHPHFLFNTLNNLYALTLQKSDMASEIVLKFSDVLNFVLFEANAEKVDLEKGILFLQNYVDLERIRYGNRLSCKFSVKGSTRGKKIAPLLVLPFVENGFKHGVSHSIDDAWMRVDLSIQGTTFFVSVENSQDVERTKDETGYTEGVGLNNVKKRLELLYPDKYDLTIENKTNRFSVKLMIELD